jgi:indole-3-glycerol phosphate synthase
MSHLLDEIVTNKLAEIKAAKSCQFPETLGEVCEPNLRDFRAALSDGRQGSPRLIAEFKRRSPSKTAFPLKHSFEEIIATYDKHAAAISILTDQKFFGGSLEDLCEAEHLSQLPLLRKDFIIDEYQILEARQFGASAILLIARILAPEKLQEFLKIAHSLDMHALVEVHNEAELEKVLKTDAEIIGINNRDLDTLKVDISLTSKLARQVPEGKIIVAESGLTSREELEELKGVVDAVLIGTSLLQAEDLGKKLEELTK